MATPMFRVDDRDLRALSKTLKFKRPSQVAAVVRSTLNDEAFATREQAQKKTMPNVFNIRNRWAISSVLVDKAQGRDTSKMQSEVGAKRLWKKNPVRPFDGLGQQEFGRTLVDPSIETLFTRSGQQFAGRVRPSLRADRLGNIVDESEYQGSGESRVIAMIRQLERQNYKGGFYIRRSKKFKKGVYVFRGPQWTGRDGKRHRTIRQVLDTSENRVRLTPRPWLRKSREKAITPGTVAAMYRKNYIRFTKPRSTGR